LKPDGSRYNLYTDGLKIYTTINSKMQKYAEEAVTQHLSKNLQVDFFREKKGYHNAPFASNLESEQVQQLMDKAIKRTERYSILHNSGASWNEIMKNFKTKVDMRVFSWNGERDTSLTPYDSIKYYKFYLQAGFMSMDPHTGYVKAYVGGPNFKHFQYDHVTVGKRQAGSTIKPFLYTLAMQEGYSPCDKVPNVAVTIPNGDTVWTPKNSGNPKYENRYVTLQWALANSVNYISAWLIQQFTPQPVIDIMKKMGVTSKQAAVPSLCLGTSEITLYEMVGAYSVFANKGIYTEPIFVTKIEDKSGNVISTFTPTKVEAISEQTAYLMVNLLRGVVNYGTGYRVRSTYNLTNPIGGKTGTTQNHSDGWFIGITPNLVSGAWVGGEDRSIHFDNLALGSGSNMALPIWALYMQKVYADPTLKITKGDFPAPAEGANFDLRCPDTNKELTEDDVKGMEGE
jgi:penicillin-binding protein 1A